MSNLSGPDDVFLSIREEPILAGSQHLTLKIDTRHCNPVTFLQHDSIVQRPPTLSRLFEELPPDDGDQGLPDPGNTHHNAVTNKRPGC